ncbi:TraB/GumN family protein [Candidatus Woesearchaeota archaeon]|nr:TraB/GumN family protein [Candidatus Woesearchaeota archaeon]
MHTIQNLIIIGTSHIAIESVNEVEKAIREQNPDIIALELDLKRFRRLVSKAKYKISLSDVRKKGFLISLIGSYIERWLGEKVGVMPGTEMKKAIQLAKERKIRIALIDQDIEITLKKLRENFTFKEKMRLLKAIFFSLFTSKKFKIDLSKVPEQKLINKLTMQLKEEYPSVYKVLIEERNKIMVSRLTKLMQENKKVLAIVGAGHLSGMEKIIRWNLAEKK